MPRLIDADKLMPMIPTEEYNARQALAYAPTVDVESLIAKHEDIGYEKGYRDGYAEALEVTDNAERHGYWCFEELPDGYYHWECSECKKWFKEDSMSLAEEWKYCPNCGVKMDESKDQSKDETKEREENG